MWFHSWSELSRFLMIAIGVLSVLQFAVARRTTRQPGGRSVVAARPALLVDGAPPTGPRAGRPVTISELRRAVRARDRSALEGVAGWDVDTDVGPTWRSR